MPDVSSDGLANTAAFFKEVGRQRGDATAKRYVLAPPKMLDVAPQAVTASAKTTIERAKELFTQAAKFYHTALTIRAVLEELPHLARISGLETGPIEYTCQQLIENQAILAIVAMLVTNREVLKGIDWRTVPGRIMQSLADARKKAAAFRENPEAWPFVMRALALACLVPIVYSVATMTTAALRYLGDEHNALAPTGSVGIDSPKATMTTAALRAFSPFGNVAAFQRGLRAELPNLNFLLVTLGLQLGNLTGAALPLQPFTQYVLPTVEGRQLQLRENTSTLVGTGKSPDIVVPYNATVAHFSDEIRRAALEKIDDNIMWSPGAITRIVRALTDRSRPINGDFHRVIWTKEESPDARWVSRSVLEDITGGNWGSLPETKYGQGVYVVPSKLREIAARASNRSIFDPDVMFLLLRDDLEEKVEAIQPRPEARPSLWSLFTGASKPRTNREPPPLRRPLTPETATDILAEDAALLKRVPFPAGMTGDTEGVQLVSGKYYCVETHWDRRLNQMIRDLEEFVHRDLKLSKDKWLAANEAIRMANQRIRDLKDAIAATKVRETEKRDQAKTAEESARERDRLEKEHQDRLAELEEEKARLAELEEEKAEYWKGARRFGAFAGLAVRLLYWVRECYSRRQIENERSAALQPGSCSVRVGDVGPYNPDVFSEAYLEFKNVLPILVWSWNKLFAEVKHGRLPTERSTVLAADYEPTTSEPQTEDRGTLRHALRMIDVQAAYGEIVGEDGGEDGVEFNDRQIYLLGLVLSDSAKVTTDSPTFWLRLYLWERLTEDQSAPYTSSQKKDLFYKIRHGPAFERQSKCLNPEGCQKGAEGAPADATFWITKTGKIWSLIDAPVEFGKTLKSKKWSEYLDELHHQRQLVGYCTGCTIKEGIESPTFKAFEDALLTRGRLMDSVDDNQQRIAAALIVARSTGSGGHT